VWTSIRLKSGTEVVHFQKTSIDKVIYSCFDPTAYSDIVFTEVNYDLMDSLNTINEEKYQRCSQDDSLNNLSKLDLKKQADTLLVKYGIQSKALSKATIQKYVFAITAGVLMGLVGFVSGVILSN